MSIKFYSTNCPKCKILKQKLDNKHIQYEEINDANLMIDMGFTEAPMLEVDNVMSFGEAIKWVNSVEGDNAE